MAEALGLECTSPYEQFGFFLYMVVCSSLGLVDFFSDH